MNTLQLDRTLDKISGFLGAFSYNQIPKSRRTMFSLILNTDSSDEPGSHWIALIYKNGVYYFMDSYGRDLTNVTFPDKFRKSMEKYMGKKSCIYCNKFLQQLTSNTCGAYACYFIYMLSSGFTLRKTLEVFSTNLKNNDDYIMKFISTADFTI